MTVTRAQLDRMSAAQPNPFRRRLRDRLIRDFTRPPHGLHPETAAERADALWIEAPKHGMHSERDVTRFCYLMMGYWDSWSESPDSPWISGILVSRSLSGKDKLDTIYKVLGEAV